AGPDAQEVQDVSLSGFREQEQAGLVCGAVDVATDIAWVVPAAGAMARHVDVGAAAAARAVADEEQRAIVASNRGAEVVDGRVDGSTQVLGSAPGGVRTVAVSGPVVDA